jgi:DNA mismatch repair ATPase MutS
MLNVILSQTYGIANALTFCISPFYFINTQINIPDVKGKQSLFEAEMFRCKYNLDIVSNLPKDRKALILMDEVFSSTNVVEGIAGAYGILKKMSSFSNVCTIVTTHFLYLTKLKSFEKFKMNVKFDEMEQISYPYKLEHGSSKQLVAIELIKKNFDEDVINTSLSIKKKLLV